MVCKKFALYFTLIDQIVYEIITLHITIRIGLFDSTLYLKFIDKAIKGADLKKIYIIVTFFLLTLKIFVEKYIAKNLIVELV